MVVDPGDDFRRAEPYLADISEAALAMGEGQPRDGLAINVPLVVGVFSRESAFGWARPYRPKGDLMGSGDWSPRERTRAWVDEQRGAVKIVAALAGGKVRVMPADGKGWGRGFPQIDVVGPFRHLIPPPGEGWPFDAQARALIRVLQVARDELAEFQYLPVFEQAVLCRYNAALDRVVRCLRLGLNPDLATTEGDSGRPDYGSDVQHRRDALIREHPEVFPVPGGMIA